jgi:hypothetical protein
MYYELIPILTIKHWSKLYFEDLVVVLKDL